MYRTLHPSVEELELDGYMIEEFFLDMIVDSIIIVEDLEEYDVSILTELVKNQLDRYYENIIGQPPDDDDYDIMFDDGDIDQAMDLLDVKLILKEMGKQL